MLPGRTYKPEDIVALLWKHRWMLVVPFVLSTFTGLLVSRFAPNRYQSDTLIQVVPQRVPESYVRSTVTARVEERLQSISQQIMSRTRLERIIQEFNLYPDARKTAIMEDIVEGMRTRDIGIDMVGGRGPQEPVDAFRVRFTYVDPRMAMRVTERLASLFIDENLRDRGSLAEATNEFLNTQLAEARSRLEAQDLRLKTFRERHAGRLPSQMQTNMQAIQNLQMQVQALTESTARDRDRRLMIERLYNDATGDFVNAAAAQQAQAPGAGLDAAGAAPAGGSSEERLATARAMLAQLELRLKPQHPDIIRMKRVIADLEKQAAEEALQQPLSPTGTAPSRPVSPEQAQRVAKIREMRAEMESLDRQIAFKEAEERRVRAQVTDYQKRLEAVPGLESEWVSLTRDYETQKQNYEDLLAKSEDSKVAANLERRQIGEQFRILDPARLPERPVSPNRGRINMVAAGVGLGLGVLLIGLREYRDSSLRSESDVRMALALPVVALIPYVITRAEARRQRYRKLLVAAASLVVFGVVGGGLTWYLRLWQYVV